MKTLFAASFCQIFLGCTTTLTYVPLDYRLVDHPGQNRVELLYLNDTGKTLCLSKGNWPNQAGKPDFAGGRVFLVVYGERFPIEDFNTGIPIDGHALRVLPGEEISGSISYMDFDLPESLRYEPKSLEYSLSAHVCQ